MKRLLCLLLCAAAFCYGTAPVFALEDGGEPRVFYSEEGEIGDPPPDDGRSTADGGDPQNDGSSQPSSDTSSQTSSDTSSQGSDNPTVDSGESPKDPPGISVNGQNQTVVELAKFKRVAFTADAAIFTPLDGSAEMKHTNEGGKLAATVYVLAGPQNTTDISVTNSPATIIIGPTAPTPSAYSLTGDISAVNLTVNGGLLLRNATTFGGSVTVTGSIDGGGFSVTLAGNLKANQFANTGTITVSNGNNAIANLKGNTLAVSGGTLSVSETAEIAGAASVTSNVQNIQAMTAKYLKAGALAVGSTLTANALAVDGKMDVPGTLTLKAMDGTYAGQGISGGDIAVSGTLLADGTVEANTGMTITGRAVAGGLQTRNGGITVNGTAQAKNSVSTGGGGDIQVNGTLDCGGALTAAGKLTVNDSASVTGTSSISAASYDLRGTVKGNNLTATNPLQTRGSMDLTGTLSAPDLTVTGPVKAGEISVSGTVTVDTRARGTASLTAQTVSAGKLTATGALSMPNSTLDIRDRVDVPGAFQAAGGTVNGPITAESVSIGGKLNAGDIKATTGDVTLSGAVTANSVTSSNGRVVSQALTAARDVRAGRDISLGGATKAGAIISDYGNVTSGSNAKVTADSVTASKGYVTMGNESTVSGRVYGLTGVTLNGGKSGSVYSDGPVNLKGTVSTGRIDAGTLTVTGTATAGAVTCKSGVVDQKASLKCGTLKSTGKLTVRGSVKADSVSGNPVSTPSGGAIYAPIINGMDRDYNGKLTITTPFGAKKNIYVELKRSGDAANGFNVTTDNNGKVAFTGLASGSYTVYAESGSSSRRGTVKVASSGTTTLDLRSSAGTGGGGQTTGGDDFFDEDDFWDDVSDEIRTARRGDTVRISASKADSVPVWILKELEGRPITLKLTHGRDSITIDGDNMYDIPSSRVFYRFDDLADLYKFPPDDSYDSSSSSAPSSSASSSFASSGGGTTAAPLPNPTPAPPAVTPPATVAPVVPAPAPTPVPPDKDEEDSSSDESSSEEESSRPDGGRQEPEEPEEPARPTEKEGGVNMVPVAVAVVLIIVSLGGIAVGYVLYRRNRDGGIYDSDDDE